MFQCSCQKRKHAQKPPEITISPIVPVSDQYRPRNSRLETDPDVFLVISCLEVSTYVFFCYKKVFLLEHRKFQKVRTKKLVKTNK